MGPEHTRDRRGRVRSDGWLPGRVPGCEGAGWSCSAHVGVLYAGVLLFALTGYRVVLYPAPAGAREPSIGGGRLERIAAPDGSTVYALHLPAPEGAPTIVHFHGNGEQLADSVRSLRACARPVSGLCRGIPRLRARPRLDHHRGRDLRGGRGGDWPPGRSLGVPADRVVLEGQSLGTGVATEMAVRGHGARLILISPYTSIVDVAAHFAPILPARVYVGDRFDTAAKAPGVSMPVLIVHGTRDEVIPVRMGQELARVFPVATLELREGSHHNDLFADPAPLVARLARFAREDR